MKKNLRYLSVYSAVQLILLLILLPNQLSAQQLFLNEIVASNGSGIADEDGDNEDWIELYYAGDGPLSLEGFGLSDDYNRPFRWVFPDVTIQPGEFLLVWASGKDRSDPVGELHTNFSIASAGEEVLLTTPDGERIDELEPTEIPTDISLARYPDGTGDWYFYEHPTPGQPNGDDGYRDILNPVEFSHTGGFFDTPFELTLTHPDPDVTIYYTLDGSEPNPEHVGGQTYSYMDRYRPSGDLQERSFETLLYSRSVTIEERTDQPNYLSHMQSAFESSVTPYYFPEEPIFKGTVVRAAAFKNGSAPSKTVTNSYFITEQIENRYSLPVISFAMQENHLFDYEEGIYVPGKIYNDTNPFKTQHEEANYGQRGIEWERPASMEIFSEETSERVHKQDMGIRIHGGASRATPQKSLRLYARNQYGDNRFYHPMFPEQPYSDYNRLILRNSGQDWDGTLLRDAMMQEIVKHMAFDTQAYRPFILFINGEYWGIQNLRERYDKHYLSRKYGVDDDNIDLLTHDKVVKEGDTMHYSETLEYIRENGLNETEHYDYIQTRIDIENFIDYQIAQIFVGNTDWPGNNIDYWRTRTDQYEPDAPHQQDGRWRWLTFDLDFGFNLLVNPSHNTLESATQPDASGWPNPPWSTFLLRSFLENNSFKEAFINRYLDQLHTAFLPHRMNEIIRGMASAIRPEMDEHYKRWNRPWGGVEDWDTRIESQLISYSEQRPQHARNHLKEYFEITDEHEVTVSVSNPSMGTVQVNSIEISGTTPGIDSEPWPWSGSYFEGVPITLKAVPLPGFRFSHWEGFDGDPYIQDFRHSLTSPLSVTAVFEEDHDAELMPAAHALNEESYHFDEWTANASAGTYPANMAFVYMDEQDPGLTAGVHDFTGGVYDLDSRTRINGLGEDGFAFINTGNDDGNPGYPGTRLGGAILALNTQGMSNAGVLWKGSTIRPNSRVYNLRLQYRIGDEGPFEDLVDKNGNPVEYLRNEEEGHRQWVGPTPLPEELNNKSYVQLLWRYYYTGERLDTESGQRSKMAVSAIRVAEWDLLTSEEITPDRPETFELMPNYPNPFNPVTVIGFQLPVSSDVTLEVFDMLGRRVAVLVDDALSAGRHEIQFDASGLSSGVYIYRLRANEFVQTRQMVLVK